MWSMNEYREHMGVNNYMSLISLFENVYYVKAYKCTFTACVHHVIE